MSLAAFITPRESTLAALSDRVNPVTLKELRQAVSARWLEILILFGCSAGWRHCSPHFSHAADVITQSHRRWRADPHYLENAA